MVVCLRPTGVKLEETWADAKKMLADTSLLDKLKRYPKDSITEKMMKSVRKYFKNPKMTVENMKSVSKAGACRRPVSLHSDSSPGRRSWVVSLSSLSWFGPAPSDRDALRATRTPSTRPTHADAVGSPTSDRDAPRNFDRTTASSDPTPARTCRRVLAQVGSVSVGDRHLQPTVDMATHAGPASSLGMLGGDRDRAQVEPLKAKVRDMEKQQAKTTKLPADLNDQLGVLSRKELGVGRELQGEERGADGFADAGAHGEAPRAASKLITGLTGNGRAGRPTSAI